MTYLGIEVVDYYNEIFEDDDVDETHDDDDNDETKKRQLT
jgi:hypothetical protein